MSYNSLDSCVLYAIIAIGDTCSRACIAYHRPSQEEVVSLGLEEGICCAVAIFGSADPGIWTTFALEAWC